MKIKYCISKKAIFDDQIIKDEILSKLKESGYNIVDITEDVIGFDNRGWGLMGNQFNKMDKGQFEIIDNGGEKTIMLTYYITLTYNFILISVFILLSFFRGYGILFLVGGLVIGTFVSIPLTKIRSEELLEQIVRDT